ncbi:MAG: hypothetical protein AAB553_08145 [Patescibacteria group bacterium]
MNRYNSGQSLVELLLVIALAAILLPALFFGFISTRDGKAQQKQRTQATTQVKEIESSLKSIESTDWAIFAAYSPGTYYPVISGSRWTFATGSATLNGITRQVAISDVYRDSSGAIVQSGGTLDPSTKRAVITVSWSEPYASSTTETLYFSRTSNLTQDQTTQSEFDAGSLNQTQTTNTAGGEVILGQGHADWCKPSDAIRDTLTLSKPGNAIIASAGQTIGATNNAYIGTGDGTSGMSFAHVSVSSPQGVDETPNPTLAGSYASSDSTNAVFSDGTYAYLATNGSSNQVKVIRLSDYSLVKTISLASNTNANGIYVANNVLYVTSSNKVYIYNIQDIMNPIQLPTTTLFFGAGTAKQIVIKDSKAYVTISGSLFGLEVFSIGIGGVLSHWSMGQFNFFQEPRGLAVNDSGSRTYVAFSSNWVFSGGFYILDTSKRWFSPWVKGQNGTYNTNGMDPRGMALATDNKAIIVGVNGTEQYHVVDIEDDSPTYCGGLALTNGATGVSTIEEPEGDVFAYVITGDTSDQFQIIEGGSGGRYTTTGIFESSPVTVASGAAFNRFVATVNQPSQTSIQLQVAIAPAISGSCTNAVYTYLGPDTTGSSYFTPQSASISGQIPFGTYTPSYQNPGNCFKYKTWFSTNDTNQTPTLYDVTVNYSP